MTSSFETQSTSTHTNDFLHNLLEHKDEFSVATYLNAALDPDAFPPPPSTTTTTTTDGSISNDEDERLQRRMAELALQLQVQTQNCHDEIGRIGAELRAVLPRCAADLGRLGLGVEGMRDDAEALLESHLMSSSVDYTALGKPNSTKSMDDGDGTDAIDGTNQDTTTSTTSTTPNQDETNHNDPVPTDTSPLETLETLSTLHALRTNIRLTKQILLAASSWDTTVTSVPSLLTSASTLTDAVRALSTLEAGEKALRGMPGRTERAETVAGVRDRIEVLLKPQLLHALGKVETRLGPLQSCVGMYAALGKMEGLMEEYVKSRPKGIHRLWFEFRSAFKAGGASAGGGAGAGGSNADGDDLEFYSDEKQSSKGTTNGTGKGGEEKDGSSRYGEDGTNNPAEEFVEWLPTWYEAVLLLLSEERRKALVVFGPDLAPEIIAKVLNECFRPIMPSFKTRLAAIYSPDVDNTNTPLTSSGSIESICATYEATLQFLSIAYEQMVEFETAGGAGGGRNRGGRGGTDGSSGTDTIATTNNNRSNGPKRTKSPVQLYAMIRSICIGIGSPFGPYQANFSKLEDKHSDSACRMVSRDIQDAVISGGGRAVTLATLQDSVDKLAGLAPFVFPLAQAAMARFESFNSGYRAPEALSTVDSFLSRHIGELSIAVETLSATLFSNHHRHHSNKTDYNDPSETFDEQRVLCALEVLKIAGIVRRDLGSFQEKTRDRLRVLAGRTAATVEQERALVEAIVKTGSDGGVDGDGGLSLVPDSLSAVEIEALLAKAVCGDADDDGGETSSVAANLRSLSSTDGEAVLLFPDSIDNIARFVRRCQSFVFDVCSAVPFRRLGSVPTLSVWREGHSSSFSGAGSDSYGTLPQSYITHVGEHMLALVQALEPFASNQDALHFTNGVMDGIEHVSLQSWKEFASITNCANPNDAEAISLLANGRHLSEYVLGKMHHSFEEDEAVDEDESTDAGAAFCNRWLDAVSSAVTGRLLSRTMQIQHVGRKGCEHLAADYDYLINVLTALGVAGHPHPLLNHVAELVKTEEEDLRARIIASEGVYTAAAVVVNHIDVRVALMRGVKIS